MVLSIKYSLFPLWPKGHLPAGENLLRCMFFAVFESMLHKYNFEQVRPLGRCPTGGGGIGNIKHATGHNTFNLQPVMYKNEYEKITIVR
jgi:hypothetical protein